MRFASLTVLSALAVLVSTAAGSCLVPNASGLVLPPVNISGHGMCPRGFYCPNSNISDPATWPVVCPPTDECVLRRRDSEFCAAQGTYEPVVCPEGYYCADGRTKLVCPKGSRCPFGTTDPFECSALSYCPEGSRQERFVGVVLVIVLVDAALAAALFFIYRRGEAESPLADDISKMTPEEAASGVAAFVREALGDAAPVHVSFQNLRVTLPENHKTSPGKSLLQGVSGNVRAGQVTAIMGPSGAGKTVLFTTLLGKQPPEWEVGGVLRVCGDLTFQDLPELVGFVAQDDVLRPELTVAENIAYSCGIRLPAEWPNLKRERLGQLTMRALGIDHVRDVRIGDGESRGVSGGQRKRCSVGVELAAAPAAMFLDEPTTGLDAFTSLNLMRLLKTVAHEARIPVATVVHQPRVEIWDELETVLLLAPGGRTVYSGPRDGAQAYFQALYPETDWSEGNPCDVCMDLIAGRGAELADAWARQEEGSSPLLAVTAPPVRTLANPFKQAAMAHARAVVSVARNIHILLLDVALCMVGGVLLTASAIDSPFVGQLIGPYVVTSPRTDIQHVSMLVMLWGIAMAAALGPAGVRVLGPTRAVYWRETAAGHSRLAYYIGASTAEAYRIVITMLHFAAVTYLMWAPNMSFGSMYGLLLLLAFVVDSQSVTLGTVVDPFIAPLLAVVVGVFTALLNGFPQIPGASQFVYSFSVTELFYAREVADVEHVFRTDSLEDIWGYKLDRPGYNFGIIFGEAALLRVLGFVFLVALHRDKQR
uniref:ABC transporter domain-containing protein n=1 Tax=Neobodo designis TaxID=312471 RepID=A0A7S1LB71_NEODS|mmetsp:Transcript_17267/g.53604  ORF Transcript_17267/g.53604 Transcript_17267/m.53604 type:complete len:764 (+) Transcript_17267:48-2339(+)